MNPIQATSIQIHLTSGRKHMFYQEDAGLVERICDDLDGHVFARNSLIIEASDDITAFPGHAIIGITILTDPLPQSFYERERLSHSIIVQISQESFEFRRLQDLAKITGTRSSSLCHLEFVSGEHLFLEFSDIAENGLEERFALHNLFTRPSLHSRRPDGGFSIWNTAHIVSWSRYPKVEVPTHSLLAQPIEGKPSSPNLLLLK